MNKESKESLGKSTNQVIFNWLKTKLVDNYNNELDTLKNTLRAYSKSPKVIANLRDKIFAALQSRNTDTGSYDRIPKNILLYSNNTTRFNERQHRIFIVLSIVCPPSLRGSILTTLLCGDNSAHKANWVLSSLQHIAKRKSEKDHQPIWLRDFIEFLNDGFSQCNPNTWEKFTFSQKAAYEFINEYISLLQTLYMIDHRSWKELANFINKFLQMKNFFPPSNETSTLVGTYYAALNQFNDANVQIYFIETCETLLNKGNRIPQGRLLEFLLNLAKAYNILKQLSMICQYKTNLALHTILPCFMQYYYHDAISDILMDYLDKIELILTPNDREAIKRHFLEYNELENASRYRGLDSEYFRVQNDMNSFVTNQMIGDFIPTIKFCNESRISDADSIKKKIDEVLTSDEFIQQQQETKSFTYNEEIEQFSLMPHSDYMKMKQITSIFGDIH